jgi:hypothetical protein
VYAQGALHDKRPILRGDDFDANGSLDQVPLPPLFRESPALIQMDR